MKQIVLQRGDSRGHYFSITVINLFVVSSFLPLLLPYQSPLLSSLSVCVCLQSLCLPPSALISPSPKLSPAPNHPHCRGRLTCPQSLRDTTHRVVTTDLKHAGHPGDMLRECVCTHLAHGSRFQFNPPNAHEVHGSLYAQDISS